MTLMPDSPFTDRSPDWREGYQFGIDTFAAELKNAKDRFASRDFCWLIEAPGPRYLMARKLVVAGMHEFVWTAEHNEALRFKSEEQADRTMMAIRSLSKELFAFEATLGNARPVEHGWMDPSGPPRPSSPPNHIAIG